MSCGKDDSFSIKEICSWAGFHEFVSHKSLEEQWAYRGQKRDWQLRTTLERALNNWGIEGDKYAKYAPAIEHKIIRDFRRKHRGESQELVASDTLFCLSLMQHYGAPTRLLDWTYSPFVAAKFALEHGVPSKQKDDPPANCAHSHQGPVIWCIKTVWCRESAKGVEGVVGTEKAKMIHQRTICQKRDDESFRKLYMPKSEEPKSCKFVLADNPGLLNERLVLQQGVFLCPGDVASTFVENLCKMDSWNKPENVVKLCFNMDADELHHFMDMLWRMNVNSAVLFPGLGGLAKSFVERVPFYQRLP